MDQLHRQIAKARRRLIMEQFLRTAGWSLFGCLLIAVFGLLVPKFWHVEVAADIWNASWIGGAFAAAILFAIGWTYHTRRTSLEAAIEIDRRYGLRERVSSVLSLPEDQLETEIGEALTRDAVRRVERIDVSEHFRVRTSWVTALPLLPVVAAIVLVSRPGQG